MSSVLALDIATQTGWAADRGKGVQYGTIDLRDCGGDLGRMFWQFECAVCDLIVGWRPEILLIERPFSRGVGANDMRLLGLCAHAHKSAYLHEIPRREVAPNTIKKFVTGSGRAPKSEMMTAVRLMGFDPANDHEADAIGLLTYWLEVGRSAAA